MTVLLETPLTPFRHFGVAVIEPLGNHFETHKIIGIGHGVRRSLIMIRLVEQF
jgi:hypothetical protein